MIGRKLWYEKMLAWREQHINHRQFMLILSLTVGILTAIAAFLLKTTIHYIQHFLVESFSKSDVNFWYLVFPSIGILISSLFVRKVVRDDISHGIS